MRILLLGGTTEASQMAMALANAGVDAVFSYAGRTKMPVGQPLETRIGGFGGLAGLVEYVRAENISHIIDATHPFASGMSRNAFDASQQAGLPLIRLERPAWEPQTGDRWTQVPAIEGLPAALPSTPSRVFLAIGKQQVALFAAKPQHHYLLRLVDAPEGPLPLPDTRVVLARGPFELNGDLALLRAHRISHIVAKNAGGSGARAKLDAARVLGLDVLMAERPAIPGEVTAQTVAEAMAWLHHVADRGV